MAGKYFMEKCIEKEQKRGLGTERIDKDNMHLEVSQKDPASWELNQGQERKRAEAMLYCVFRRYVQKD